MIAEITVIPIGTEESLSKYIAEAVKAFKGFKHEVTATGTIVEIDDFDDLCKLLKRIKENLEKVKVPRIYFSIKVDYKKAKDTIERRVRSINE